MGKFKKGCIVPPKKKKSKTPPKKMGAPTKYKPEYCEGMIKYFTTSGKFPFFSEYSRKIQVNTDTLQEWKKVHANFSVSFKECKEIQKERLVRGALTNDLNSTFSIFTAKNILGWRDVKEIKQDIKTEHDLSPALADMFNKIYKKET